MRLLKSASSFRWDDEQNQTLLSRSGVNPG